MSTALIVARLMLATVFTVAALAKLADRPGSRKALDGFGVPPHFVAAAVVALPVAELCAAILLLPSSTARAGAVLGAALLAVFVAGIVGAMRQGRTPDCHCFGQLHSKPAGAETVARNMVLLCIALFVAVAGAGPSFGSWISDHDAAQAALVGMGFVTAILAFACHSLWQENRGLKGYGPQAATALATMGIGQRAPAFSLQDLDGATVSSDDLLGDQRAVLVFISSSCGPCAALLPNLARWKEHLAGRLGIHVIAAGDDVELRRLAAEHRIEMLLDPGGSVSRAWGVPATPSGIEIETGGTVATLPASGAPAVEGLIRVALKRPAASAAVRVRHVRPVEASTVTD
jgi:peroxiredoxin/uncharacterized membrane protein YphA (DoxX/SURF4 family)